MRNYAINSNLIKHPKKASEKPIAKKKSNGSKKRKHKVSSTKKKT